MKMGSFCGIDRIWVLVGMTSFNTRGVALWMTLAVVPAFAACNMVTGADDVTYSDDDDGQSTSSGTATGGGATGTGQQAATTGVTAGAGGATSGTPAATAAATTSTGAGAGGPGCDAYPAGPYGVAQGQVVPPTLSWQGYAPGASSPSTITMQDLWDCDGMNGGIDAIIIDTSQYG